MSRLVIGISALVRRAPLPVVVVAIVLTGVLGWFAQDVEQATGNEGFAPDNPELDASDTIAERFGEGETVMQVLVEVEGGFVSNEGMEAVAEITEAIEDSEAGPHLSDQPERPAVVSSLIAVEQAQAQGAPADLDDQQIRDLLSDVVEQMPATEADFVTGLLPQGTDISDPDAEQGLVVVFFESPEIDDLEQQFQAVTDIKSAAVDAIAEADLPPGASAEPFAYELLFDDMEEFQAEISRLFGTAFLIILTILAFVYWVRPSGRMGVGKSLRRTVADIAMTMATILMAIVWMNGAAALLGPGYAGLIGGMSEVTMVLPVLLIGLGVDYGIHLTSRYREEVPGGPVAGAVSTAIRTVGIALALATMTTAVGFLTNVVNPVPALRDFGVLAAIGITASFLLMLTFVPGLRLLMDRRAERAGRLASAELATTSDRTLPKLMGSVSVLAQRAAIPMVLVTVVLGGALGVWGLSNLETEFSFMDFVPEDDPLIETVDTIEERFGGGFGERTRILVSGDVATPETHNALVAAVNDVGDAEHVPTVGGEAAASAPVTVLGRMLAPGPEGQPTAPAVAQAAQEQGLRDDLTVPADADVEALYEAMIEADPEQAGAVLATDDDGGFDHALLEVRTSAGESGAAELIDDLGSTVVEPLEATGVTAVATSDEIISEVIAQALSDSQVSSLLITLSAALILLTLTFGLQRRRPLLGAITIAPVGLVVLWTFAAMAATGIPFGPVTATIAALAIGIGVPYTIHVTNRFSEDRRRLPLNQAIASTVRHTGGALAGSAFTTVAGFGVLVTSSLTPFQQFGAVTAFAIGFALIAATLVLPSMLVLWDRYHQARGRDNGFGYRPRHSRETHAPLAEPVAGAAGGPSMEG